MARNSMDLPTGVELRNGAIRIRFTRDGQRYSETLPYPANQQGIAAAARLRDQVITLSKLGLLDDTKYVELFPGSANCNQAINQTFGAYCQVWLNGKSITAGTRDNYKHTLNNWWMPSLATLPLSAITPALLRQILGQTAYTSDGVRSSAMVKLKTILTSALNDGLITKHPMLDLHPPRLKKKVVDPFTQEQTEQILEALQADPLKYSDFFEFVFFTGMRLAEVMALRWEEVDLQKKTAYVCRIVSKGKVEERTKTGKFRHVLLNSRALHALESSKQKTASSYCFPTLRDGTYIAQVSLIHRGWRELLQKLNIRYRPPYNGRHTYASRCLMAGMKPGFIANQLGHSVQILLSTYARWMSQENDWDEMQKFEIGTGLAQDIISEPEIL